MTKRIDPEHEWMNVKAAADVLGVSERKMYRIIESIESLDSASSPFDRVGRRPLLVTTRAALRAKFPNLMRGK